MKGIIRNLDVVSNYMASRNYLGILWGDMAYDARRSSGRRITVLLLRGSPIKGEYGVNWVYRGPKYKGTDKVFPFKFVRTTSHNGLYWFGSLVERYYGMSRKSMSSYLPEFPMGLQNIRVFPDRSPDRRGLVRRWGVDDAGGMAVHYSLDGLLFASRYDLDIHIRDNVRFFTLVYGTARTNDGAMAFNHWNIGPIR